MSLSRVRPSLSKGLSPFQCPANVCVTQWQARRWQSAATAPDSRSGPFSVAREARNRGQERSDKQYSRAIAAATERSAIFKNQTRNWKPGDVYSPRDLLPGEMRKWRVRESPSVDIFDHLGLDPLKQYKNFSIMSEYVTDMGRIKHSSETGLRPVNQRKIAKAIRRAIGLGLMPTVYKHPEILIDNLKYQER